VYSPLARGTLAGSVSNTSPARFIPAGAGNTKIGIIDGLIVPIYPRWRGEHMQWGISGG
ncbi:hypothetical protein SEEN2570_16975, partial [Salmonella enterica subsp. enterica serovar Newport str. VA_R100512570]